MDRFKRREDGFTILEVTVSLAMVALAMVLAVQSMIGLGRTRRSDEQRSLAIQEAANLMEAIQVRSWDELSNEQVSAMKFSEQFQSRVPKATLNISITLVDEPAAKRITIAIARPDPAGRSVTLAVLTAWRYREAEVP